MRIFFIDYIFFSFNFNQHADELNNTVYSIFLSKISCGSNIITLQFAWQAVRIHSELCWMSSLLLSHLSLCPCNWQTVSQTQGMLFCTVIIMCSFCLIADIKAAGCVSLSFTPNHHLKCTLCTCAFIYLFSLCRWTYIFSSIIICDKRPYLFGEAGISFPNTNVASINPSHQRLNLLPSEWTGLPSEVSGLALTLVKWTELRNGGRIGNGSPL